MLFSHAECIALLYNRWNTYEILKGAKGNVYLVNIEPCWPEWEFKVTKESRKSIMFVYQYEWSIDKQIKLQLLAKALRTRDIY